MERRATGRNEASLQENRSVTIHWKLLQVLDQNYQGWRLEEKLAMGWFENKSAAGCLEVKLPPLCLSC